MLDIRIEWEPLPWLDRALTGNGTRQAVETVARRVERKAQAIVRAEATDTGELMRSISSSSYRESGRGRRWIGVAKADADYAAIIEFGANGRPGVHYLKRAAEANGRLW